MQIPAIPAAAFKMPQIQLPPLPKIELDLYRKFAASIEPVLRAASRSPS